MAIAFANDWRWLQDHADTPWYPTMRLFRQPKAGDWRTVFKQMAESLRQLVPEQDHSYALDELEVS